MNVEGGALHINQDDCCFKKETRLLCVCMFWAIQKKSLDGVLVMQDETAVIGVREIFCFFQNYFCRVEMEDIDFNLQYSHYDE